LAEMTNSGRRRQRAFMAGVLDSDIGSITV
jgi:hypothetical protein